MKVSVIIPTHNRAELLKRSIQSALSQTLQDLECIVVDDFSSDSTAEVVKSMQAIDNRVLYIRLNEKGNLQKVLNTGLKASNGEYIARLDDDDYWTDQDKLKKQAEFLDANPDYLFLGTNAEFYDRSGNQKFKSNLPVDYEQLKQKALLQNYFLSSTVLFRKAEAIQMGGFSEDVSLAGDYGLWLSLGTKGKFKNLADYTSVLGLSDSGLKKRRLLRVKDSLKIISKYKKSYPSYFKGVAIRYALLVYLYLIPEWVLIDRLLYRVKVSLMGRGSA